MKIDKLIEKHSQVTYSPTISTEYDLSDAFNFLLKDDNSNIGWRIIAEYECSEEELRSLIKGTMSGNDVVELLDNRIVKEYRRAIWLVERLIDEEELSKDEKRELKKIVEGHLCEILNRFEAKEEEEEEIDKTLPVILLTSYVGRKGLSAGHVFIVGANDGCLPRDPDDIDEVEISQFVVALTRTRKQCHVISNDYFIGPKNYRGEFVPKLVESEFITWLPESNLDNRGPFKAQDFK